jgi:DNA-binding SARP family transcriptional activator/predicted ATPase/pimeloyl-ACP methyl ester carboxylesterase
MAGLRLYLLGNPRLERNDKPVAIARRKALALLAYLAATRQSHSRDELATLFWPDQNQSGARASLRRDLSSLKRVLGAHALIADQAQIGFNPEVDVWIDAEDFQAKVTMPQSHAHDHQAVCADCLVGVTEAVELYVGDFMAGFNLPDSPAFDEWQFFETERLRQLLAHALQSLVRWHVDHGEYEQGITYARRWLALDPLHEAAHRQLMQLYAWAGQQSAALRQYQECVRLLEEELRVPPDGATTELYEAIRTKQLASPHTEQINRAPPAVVAGPAPPGDTASTSAAPSSLATASITSAAQQQIRFCTAPDGVRIAYSLLGDGPPLIKAANWLSHLEYDWHSPIWQHWLIGLAQHHTLIRYDERGCGLSDWAVDDFSFDAWVRDLEAVIDAAHAERFPLIGISKGGSIAIAYAARHPEKVSHLILYGAYARGRLIRHSNPQASQEADLMTNLIRLGWGQETPAFRQVFASTFMPDGTLEQYRWFDDLQRASASPENAARIYAGSNRTDVRELAAQLRVPTLVLHARGDMRVPLDEGRLLAALVPGAQLITLDSNNHILLEHEPAWQKFLTEVHHFLEATPDQPVSTRPIELAARSRPRHQLPAQPTSFIGREQELADIRSRMADDPACRLLTLIGPGGIGKTRLAIEAASHSLAVFRDGAALIPLASIGTAELILSALAEALDFNLAGPAEPKVQLLNYLRDKQLLLIFDNFEHVLDGAHWLSAILGIAPQVKILVTSRERLSLQEEWAYAVQGMTFPEADELNTTALESYSAVRLFMRQARHAVANFAPTADDLHAIARICQLVEGSPLAVELAGAWVNVLECAAIADEVQRGLEVLTAQRRDIAEHHRSMRVVFDRTWARLTAAERRVFQQLSVFRGGFTRSAAEQVADAALSSLSALADKSLLHRDPIGRYQIHELLRQYAAQHLADTPDDEARSYDRHCSYYAALLKADFQRILDGHQLDVARGIEAEIGNIRAAWSWALAHSRIDFIDSAVPALWPYYQFRCRYLEGANVLARALVCLRAVPTTEAIDRSRALTQVSLAWLYIRLGRIVEAEECLAAALIIYERRQMAPVMGVATDPRVAFGIIASIRGNYVDMMRLGEEAVRLSEQSAHHWNRPYAFYLLTRAALVQGDYQRAQIYAQEASAAAQRTGDRWFLAYCLIELGNVALAQDEFEQAKEHFQASYDIRREFEDREGMAIALNRLGTVALRQERIAEAGVAYRQSLDFYRELDDKGGLASTQTGLGFVAVADEDYAAAAQHFRRALDITQELHYAPLTLWILLGIGEMLLKTHQLERGVELLALVVHHPASEREAGRRAQRRLDRFHDRLSADRFAASYQSGRQLELDHVATRLLTDLLVWQSASTVSVGEHA